jgi:hypothetical protein
MYSSFKIQIFFKIGVSNFWKKPRITWKKKFVAETVSTTTWSVEESH